MLIRAACHSSSATACAASAAFTSAARVLRAREQLLLLVALGLRDLLAELLLLGPLGLEVGDRRTSGGVRGERPVHDVVGQPALGLGGTHAVGVVSEHLRVDHVARLSGYGARSPGIRAAPAGPAYCASPYRRRPEGSRVLDRPRVVALSWAAACLVLFVLLAIGVDQDWGLIQELDDVGRVGRDVGGRPGLAGRPAALGRGDLRRLREVGDRRPDRGDHGVRRATGGRRSSASA